MGTLANAKPFVPYMDTKECSQRLCSLSACPEWCYSIFPPPPPPLSTFPDDKSQTGSTFSPLVIAIIGILASAFLLVSYYAIISKYCGNPNASTRRDHQQRHLSPNGDVIDDQEDNHNHHEPFQHEPWFVSTTGLDEALIKAITLIKYKKKEGLVGSTDCSVCLGEFLEDDTLRLLPKCSHAFHVSCIDTWLKSHSNCPLCRANIVSTFSQSPPLVVVVDHNSNLLPQEHGNQVLENDEIRSNDQGGTRREVMGFVEQPSGNLPKSPFRAFSDLGGLGLRENHGGEEGGHMIRRSISMDHCHETRVSIPSILRIDQREVFEVENCELHDECLKETGGESSSKSGIGSSNSRSGVLQCVMSSVAMKRSFSSGRFLFLSKHGRGNNAVIIPA